MTTQNLQVYSINVTLNTKVSTTKGWSPCILYLCQCCLMCFPTITFLPRTIFLHHFLNPPFSHFQASYFYVLLSFWIRDTGVINSGGCLLSLELTQYNCLKVLHKKHDCHKVPQNKKCLYICLALLFFLNLLIPFESHFIKILP